MTIQPDCKIAFTIREAAEACSVPQYAIRCAIRAFELTPRKVNRASVLTRNDLLNWLNTRPRFIATRERKTLAKAYSPFIASLIRRPKQKDIPAHD
jgi:hypothetical protein